MVPQPCEHSRTNVTQHTSEKRSLMYKPSFTATQVLVSVASSYQSLSPSSASSSVLGAWRDSVTVTVESTATTAGATSLTIQMSP